MEPGRVVLSPLYLRGETWGSPADHIVASEPSKERRTHLVLCGLEFLVGRAKISPFNQYTWARPSGVIITPDLYRDFRSATRKCYPCAINFCALIEREHMLSLGARVSRMYAIMLREAVEMMNFASQDTLSGHTREPTFEVSW